MPLSIGGQVVEGPKTFLLILERGDQMIPFKFKAVTDESEFLNIFPEPEPPRTFQVKTQTTVADVENIGFKAKHKIWTDQKFDWFILKSMEESKIGWQMVKMEDPSTYHLWRDELKDAGFSVGEINQIFNSFVQTNMVTDAMLTEARKRFLASQEAVSSPVP